MTDIAAEGLPGATAIPGMTGAAPAAHNSTTDRTTHRGRLPGADQLGTNGRGRADGGIRPYGQVPQTPPGHQPGEQPGAQPGGQQPGAQPGGQQPSGQQPGPQASATAGAAALAAAPSGAAQAAGQSVSRAPAAPPGAGQLDRGQHAQRPGSRAEGGTERGRTKIAEEVVEKIAGLAARQVQGVYSLGGDVARALGSIRERIGLGDSKAQGVSVEMAERRVIVDLVIVVEYGYVIMEVATAVRANVITAVERMLGLQVVEVNIAVDDVHMPDEEGRSEARNRPER